MKPAAFAYHAPSSLNQVYDLLEQVGEDGRVLAGGQSLVPAMNFRLARPAALIDINRVPGLDRIEQHSGQLRIGAMTRHARFEQPITDGPLGRLLPRAAACIAHTPIRSRGTFGGSLAHADPAAEWCAVSLALDAEIVAASRHGTRTIPASQFFTTIFTTALRPDEVLTEIRLPQLDASWRCGFAEFSRRAGDYALAMAVVALRLDHGIIRQARIALGGVASTPVLAPTAMQTLTDATPDEAVLAEAAAAARAEVNPEGDIHGSAEYRRDLVRVMVARALRDALSA